uniref:Uncharacterized protein n=1 Tax=Steinernema glaseri TaxID=37863 RepID=A0A1I8AGW2_9BILA
MVERSQAAIIRVGTTLPRLAEAQEELRQMVVALLSGRTNVPIQTPPPTHSALDPVKNEEEEEEEISRIGLSATTSPCVERDEEEKEVSSVSSEEEIDLQDTKKTYSSDPGEILRRSLEMLERSQLNLEGSLANLERSLAIENTLSRLVDSQEELRRVVVVVLITRADVPAASPSSTNGTDLTERDPSPLVKNEEDEIERTDLPVRNEEEVDITLTEGLPTRDPAPSVKHEQEEEEDQIERTELPTTSASPPEHGSSRIARPPPSGGALPGSRQASRGCSRWRGFVPTWTGFVEGHLRDRSK